MSFAVGERGQGAIEPMMRGMVDNPICIPICARRLGPSQVVPIHDFYMSESGRSWSRDLVRGILANDRIELLDLDWGDSATI